MYIHFMTLNSIQRQKFELTRENGIIDFLFLYFHTPLSLTIKEKHYSITTPSVILIDSYVPHQYFATGGNYVDDYLHFAPTDRDSFLSKLTFPLNTPIQLSNNSSISQLLNLIEQENNPTNKNWNHILEPLFDILMIKIGEEWERQDQILSHIPHFSELSDIRNMILQSPEKTFTIPELAKKVNLSPSYFQVMYKKAFQTTCISDLIYTKIASAKTLLLSTDSQIKEIAVELGYNEVYHFIRQFKKYTGQTPSAFRKIYRG